MANVDAIVFQPTSMRDPSKLTKAEKAELEDKSKWEFVEVPDEDMFQKRHQGADINGFKFVAGKTYMLPPSYAAELRRILMVSAKADMRILQANPDVRSVEQQARNGNASGAITFTRDL